MHRSSALAGVLFLVACMIATSVLFMQMNNESAAVMSTPAPLTVLAKDSEAYLTLLATSTTESVMGEEVAEEEQAMTTAEVVEEEVVVGEENNGAALLTFDANDVDSSESEDVVTDEVVATLSEAETSSTTTTTTEETPAAAPAQVTETAAVSAPVAPVATPRVLPITRTVVTEHGSAFTSNFDSANAELMNISERFNRLYEKYMDGKIDEAALDQLLADMTHFVDYYEVSSSASRDIVESHLHEDEHIAEIFEEEEEEEEDMVESEEDEAELVEVQGEEADVEFEEESEIDAEAEIQEVEDAIDEWVQVLDEVDMEMDEE